MLVVHHLSHSRSQRILWLLEELDVPYEISFYEREAGSHLAPEALKSVHPLGKSPVITDDGRAVAESGAIVDYIIRRHGAGRLAPLPDSWLYDQYMQWLHYAEGSAALPLIMKGLASYLGEEWRPLKQRIDIELDTHLSYIERSLGERDYLVGNTFSAADVQMSFIGELAALRTDRSRYPNLEAWVGRFQCRPGYQAAIRRGGPYALGG
ncbi:glutathione S-transferase family protein [Frateuria hangzhouensis]|uniref:glutathione S-transferase family protein n=1 Tax=Frateuria hangzhouensis TaxID=2995589 RepID=UPI002260AD9A|nr:glutathione S-transferase [Frateuria sp. STR12]MCX7513087.1 glutathione S-transferase [Frateuria sp. STR12]